MNNLNARIIFKAVVIERTVLQYMQQTNCSNTLSPYLTLFFLALSRVSILQTLIMTHVSDDIQ